MRQSQKNNRTRSRGRKPSNPLTRSYDSNGPDVKIRGTANHIAEKYQSLARDALASGDIVMAENYYQHAEHYLRIIAAAQAPNRDQDNRSNSNEASGNERNGRRNSNVPDSDEEASAETNAGTTASELEVLSPDNRDAAGEAKASEKASEKEAGEQDKDESQVAPRRRRRTTYRPRKRATNAAEQVDGDANGAQPNPVSLPDAPQPVISDD